MTNQPPIQPLAVNSQITIATTHGELDGIEQPLVNARELHTFLESGQQFTNWIQSRIKEYKFIQGIDFLGINNFIKTEAGFFGVREKKVMDYHLSLDMAKELAMVERNDKGRQARRYFIDVEKRAVAQAQAALTSQQTWLIDELQDAYLANNPRDAKLVRLYACGQLSNPEIAKVLDLTPSTVRYHLKKLNALQLLRYPRPTDYQSTTNGQLSLSLAPHTLGEEVENA